MGLSVGDIKQQSLNAFSQWEKLWKTNARINGEIFKKQELTHQDFSFLGVGKTLVIVAMGSSLEDHIDTIKKYREKIGVMCVDKAFGALMDRGIRPDYVVLCDAVVDYKDWAEKHIENTGDIVLVSNVTASTDWTKNWLGKKVFFVNKDTIKSEEIFSSISGCKDLIPAGSNVGNAAVIFATQVLGYAEYILVGYDFGWADGRNYYAFNPTTEKRHWLKHIEMIDSFGNLFNTSNNLMFSARWLNEQFYHGYVVPNGIKLYDASGIGISCLPYCNLEKKLSIVTVDKISQEQKELIAKRKIKKIITNDTKALNDIFKTHKVVNVEVNYLPEEVVQWLN